MSIAQPTARLVGAGTRLGPYEIVSRVGAGGMGEVWRARDTRLGREVAVKILTDEFAADEKRQMRFAREAKTISQLNHPHICTVHDVGHDSGVAYLVMELIDGETLRAHIARGPLPIERVIAYGAQIAEALDKAHRAGIVHRDLKPSNVMITKSSVKLLDFGLAKRQSDASAEASTSSFETPLTDEREIVGTIQYMAPEQLAGDEPDARSDIFALGAVLYEMATGRHAFEGTSRTSIVAAIISGDPKPMTEAQPLTPAALEHVVKKCLAKDPDDRWQSTADVADELRWIAEARSQDATPAAAGRQQGRVQNWRIAAAAGWLLLALAAVTAVVYVRQSMRGGEVMQTDVAIGDLPPATPMIALSPDATLIACAVAGEEGRVLRLRNLRTGETRDLDGTTGALYPFWSPDSRSIGFFADGKLKTINTQTGAVHVLCDAPEGRGGAWSQNGVILFAPGAYTPLFKVAVAGGTPVAVTRLPATGSCSHRNPLFLPDGEHFLFASMPPTGKRRDAEMLGSLDGSEPRKLLDYGTTAALVGTNLLTVRSGTIFVQPFDAHRLELAGSPHPLAPDVQWYWGRRVGAMAAAGNLLVYRPAPRPKRLLVVSDTKGNVAAAGTPRPYGVYFHVSPDGKTVTASLLDVSRNEFQLVVIDLDTGASSPLVAAGDAGTTPGLSTAVFSPDGSHLLITIIGNTGPEMWIQPVAGGTRDVLLKGDEALSASDWSPDGKIVFFERLVGGSGKWQLEYLALDGSRQPVTVLPSAANQDDAQLTPDQRWIAFISDESGKWEVYVTSFPAGSQRFRISPDGGSNPRWSSDGRVLYYLAGGAIRAVDVRDQPGFATSSARTLDVFGNGIVGFDVARDGRIVALRAVDRAPQPLRVVENWQRLLDMN